MESRSAALVGWQGLHGDWTACTSGSEAEALGRTKTPQALTGIGSLGNGTSSGAIVAIMGSSRATRRSREQDQHPPEVKQSATEIWMLVSSSIASNQTRVSSLSDVWMRGLGYPDKRRWVVVLAAETVSTVQKSLYSGARVIMALQAVRIGICRVDAWRVTSRSVTLTA